MEWTAALNGMGHSWLAWMTASSLELTILLAAAGGIWLLGHRHISPHAGYWLFVLVLVKGALPLHVPIPVASAWWPAGSLDRPAEDLSVAPTAKVDQRRAAPTSALPVAMPAAALPSANLGESPAADTRAMVGQDEPTAVVLAWPAVGMLVWAAVVLLLVASTAWQHVRLLRSLRHCAPTQLPGIDLAELASRLGLRRAVPALTCPGLGAPAVTGLLRPTLLMPEKLAEQLTREQLDWVLLHELAHVRRGDLWAAAGQRLLTTILFFHPAAWLASWIVDQFRECACDDLALTATHAPRRACGEAFVVILERSRQLPLQPMATLGMSRGMLLARRRLVRLIDSQRQATGKLSWVAAFALGLFAVAIVPRLEARDTDHTRHTEPSSSTSATQQRPAAPIRPAVKQRIVETGDVAQELQAIWLQQGSAIRTARLQMRVMILERSDRKDRLQQGHELKSITRDETNAILGSVDLATHPQDLRIVRDQLLDGRLIVDQPVWHDVQLLSDGVKVRVDWQASDSFVSDGRALVWSSPKSHQATIYQGSEIFWPRRHASRLLEFPHAWLVDSRSERMLPYLRSSRPPELYGRIISDAQGKLDRMYAENPGVRIHGDVFQYGYALFDEVSPGQPLLFPCVRVETSYLVDFPPSGPKHTLQRIAISVLEEAEFNKPIPAEAFRVGVPANTAVWDRRNGLKLRAAEKPVDDVLTLFDPPGEPSK